MPQLNEHETQALADSFGLQGQMREKFFIAIEDFCLLADELRLATRGIGIERTAVTINHGPEDWFYYNQVELPPAGDLCLRIYSQGDDVSLMLDWRHEAQGIIWAEIDPAGMYYASWPRNPDRPVQLETAQELRELVRVAIAEELAGVAPDIEVELTAADIDLLLAGGS